MYFFIFRILNSCDLYNKLLFNDGSFNIRHSIFNIRKGKPPNIEMQLVKKANKKVLKIQGHEIYKFDTEELCKEFQTLCASSVSCFFPLIFS